MDLLTLALARKGGGASSWNDLKDKPFGSEVTDGVIEIDGDASKYEHFTVQEIPQVKVSDKVVEPEDFVGSTAVVISDGTIAECTITEDCIKIISNPNDETQKWIRVDLYDGNGDLRGVVCAYTNMEQIFGVKDGTYFSYQDENNYVKSISCLTGPVETIKPIDEKYLPPLVSPSGKKFKLTVDDNGTITATEVT